MTQKENSLLNMLEANFRSLKTFNPKYADQMRAIMRRAPQEALEAMIERKIPFCDTFAVSELIRRGVLTEEARVDHIVDLIIRGVKEKAA